MFDFLRSHGLQHTRLPCSSPTPRACSNSCPLSQWCYQTISSAVIPFSSCLQSFPALGSFPMSQFFASNSQTIGASASASGLSMNIQDRFPLGWTGLIFLQFKGLSRVFSNTTVQKHQFFGAQLLSSKRGKTQLWCCSKSECWLPLVQEFIGWEGAWESFFGWCNFKRNLDLNSGCMGICLCKGPSSCTCMFYILDSR